MSDEREIIVCLLKCWPCALGSCEGGPHGWADEEDLAHAASIGKPETAGGQCGCPCVNGLALSPEPDDLDGEDDVVGFFDDTGDSCDECGATGACAYDANGRPLIHSSGFGGAT